MIAFAPGPEETKRRVGDAMLSLFLSVFSPQVRDVFAIYILIGVAVVLFQYVVKYIWNLIARLKAKIKGEDYHKPPF